MTPTELRADDDAMVANDGGLAPPEANDPAKGRAETHEKWAESKGNAALRETPEQPGEARASPAADCALPGRKPAAPDAERLEASGSGSAVRTERSRQTESEKIARPAEQSARTATAPAAGNPVHMSRWEACLSLGAYEHWAADSTAGAGAPSTMCHPPLLKVLTCSPH